MYGSQMTPEFISGLSNFMEVAKENKQEGFMSCQCKECMNQKQYSSLKIIHLHLLRYGFMPSYNCWTKHGERWVMMEDNEEEEEEDDNYHPMFPEYGDSSTGEAEDEEAPPEDEEASPDDLHRAIDDIRRESDSNIEKLKLDRLLKDHKKMLYPTCEHDS